MWIINLRLLSGLTPELYIEFTEHEKIGTAEIMPHTNKVAIVSNTIFRVSCRMLNKTPKTLSHDLDFWPTVQPPPSVFISQYTLNGDVDTQSGWIQYTPFSRCPSSYHALQSFIQDDSAVVIDTAVVGAVDWVVNSGTIPRMYNSYFKFLTCYKES